MTIQSFVLKIAVVAAMASDAVSAQDGIPGAERAAPIYSTSAPGVPTVVDAGLPAPGVAITTLREAIGLAYAQNPNLLADRAILRATDERVPAARAAYGPTLDVQAAQAYQRDAVELLPKQFVIRNGWSNSATLIFNQPIFTFGRLRSAENVARAEVALERESLRLREAQVLLDVINAYTGVIRDTLSVNIAQENLNLLGQQYRDNAERFRVRDITSTDLQQIETRVEVGRAQLLLSQGALGTSRAQFLQATGAPAAPELNAPAPLPLGAPTLQQAYDIADANNALIRGARARERGSRARVDAARAETGPSISLRGTAAYATVSPYSTDLRTTSLRGEAVLSQPLIDSGLRRAGIRGANQANEADWLLIDQALRDARQSVASAWSQSDAATLAVQNYIRAEDAARRAYAGAVEQEKAGARTTLDVLDLLRDLLNVRLSRVGAEANAYVARASLLASMGRLEAPLLFSDLRGYDPTAHFEKVRRKSDVPLLTDGVALLDALPTRGIEADRPVRDPAGPLRTDAPRMIAEPALPPLTRK